MLLGTEFTNCIYKRHFAYAQFIKWSTVLGSLAWLLNYLLFHEFLAELQTLHQCWCSFQITYKTWGSLWEQSSRWAQLPYGYVLRCIGELLVLSTNFVESNRHKAVVSLWKQLSSPSQTEWWFWRRSPRACTEILMWYICFFCTMKLNLWKWMWPNEHLCRELLWGQGFVCASNLKAQFLQDLCLKSWEHPITWRYQKIFRTASHGRPFTFNAAKRSFGFCDCMLFRSQKWEILF